MVSRLLYDVHTHAHLYREHRPITQTHKYAIELLPITYNCKSSCTCVFYVAAYFTQIHVFISMATARRENKHCRILVVAEITRSRRQCPPLSPSLSLFSPLGLFYSVSKKYVLTVTLVLLFFFSLFFESPRIAE